MGAVGNNQMATEQAFYGLVAAQRSLDGSNSLYNMSDAKKRGNDVVSINTVLGLPGKHADVKAVPITAPGKTFEDIENNQNKTAIEALAERGIINGKTAVLFEPDATMSRAEFATILVHSLGLTAQSEMMFSDVNADAWYAGYVNIAYTCGLVTGTGETTFNPQGTISKQEAAMMMSRAAKLAGMDTDMNEVAVRDILAGFGDYVTAANWAWPDLAFCYANGLFDDAAFDIEPIKEIRRSEIAEVLYRLLAKARLLR